MYVLKLAHGQLNEATGWKWVKGHIICFHKNINFSKHSYLFQIIQDTIQRYTFEQCPLRPKGKVREENGSDQREVGSRMERWTVKFPPGIYSSSCIVTSFFYFFIFILFLNNVFVIGCMNE